MSTFLSHPLPYLATAAFAVLIILYVHTQPHRPGARQFNWLMGVYLLWALAGALATLVDSSLWLYSLFVLQSICALSVAGLELMIVLEYTGSEIWIARRGLLLLFLPPLFFAVIAFAAPQATASLEYHSGTAFLVGQPAVKWGSYAYVSIMFLISVSVLLNRLMRAPAFWAPILLLSVGAVVPVIGYAFIRPEWVPVSPIQVAILMTNFTMLTYFLALYGFQILQVTPVARDMLISRLPYGLIVLDSEDHLVDFNAAAQALPGLPGRLVMRKNASQALGTWWGRIAPMIGREPSTQDLDVETELGKRIFHTTSLPLLQASGWRLGQLFLVEDVTEARQAQLQHEETLQSLVMLKEREQLARELHDSLGQVLGYISMQAQALRKRTHDGQTDSLEPQLARLAEVAQEAHREVRESIFDLKTGPAGGWSFFAVLRDYLARYQEHYGVRADLIIPEGMTEDLFEIGATAQLLRVIQEALTNTRKHGQATHVQVSFACEDDQAQIVVADDGRGFDPDQMTKAADGHFGLAFMRERMEQIGGSLAIATGPGAGTRVILRAPIRERQEEAA